ncbi:hypothetical protein G5C41_07455 [Burkholderia pseudomallei]|nr:hypothetical protein DO70_3812 [Burkholderia pseudomallei]MBD2937365.1 hypothetical protein [Burkholderia pseudomallei]MBD2943445.1 hypothetical protein [Burkholderia pseudomallei]MBD2950282.1 hypothetical protein [Burkholderia pseudomallei]MBD2961084.1 hypothetical protein [Burkholderia pseudomallei]
MRAVWGYQTSRRDHNPAFTRSARAAQRARRLRPPRYGDISSSRMHARNRDVTQCRHAGSRAARGARRARFAPQLHSPVSNLNRTGT